MQSPTWENSTQGWLKPKRRSTAPWGIVSDALLALPAKGLASPCPVQVTVGFTRGKIPPPHPATPVSLPLGPKIKTHTGVFTPPRYSTQMSNPSSVCSHLCPPAIWQQCNQSLGVQMTLKRHAQCSPKQMVIYTGHWKHGCVQPLHGNMAVSMAALLSPPGCGTAGYPRRTCLPCQASLLRMPAWHWQGDARSNTCCRGTRAPAKSGLLLFILVGKAMAGQAKPTFKTCFLAEGAARLLFLTGLCCRWRASCRYILRTMWKDRQESHAR